MCVLEGYIESHKTLQEIVVAGKVVVVVVDKCASKKVGWWWVRCYGVLIRLGFE